MVLSLTILAGILVAITTPGLIALSLEDRRARRDASEGLT